MGLMDSLTHLHEVDLQVRGLRSRLESANRYLTAQQTQLDSLLQQREEFGTRKRHTQASIGNLETETRAIDERIEKLRDQLNSASTNKEYSALLAELNTFKASHGEIEERILAEMEAVEKLNGQVEEQEEQILERQKVRDVAASQLEERRAEIGERLAELETEREQAAASVPPQYLAVFEEVATIHDGEAMASLDEIDRRHREYACGECHMTVPFEHVSVLLSGAETLVRCTACSRILFMHAETRGALQP